MALDSTYDFLLNYSDLAIGLFAAILGSYLSYRAFKAGSEVKALDIRDSLSDLSSAKSVQEIAASQIKLLSSYYNNVLSQSQRSFYFALTAAGVGLLFFMIAGGVLLLYNLQSLALITTLGGALSSFVSGVNFHIYNKSSSQLIDFHQRLDMTQRFLLADGLCNSIKDSTKQDATRADLITTIAGSEFWR